MGAFPAHEEDHVLEAHEEDVNMESNKKRKVVIDKNGFTYYKC